MKPCKATIRLGTRMAALLLACGGLALSPARAGDGWPEFRSGLIALHVKLIAAQPVRIEQGKVLPYEGLAGKDFFYQDVDYYEQASGRLISHIRRSPEAPYRYYEIEVNIHDAAGRVIRDFAAITLPWQLEHPARTFINLHDYPGELHAFRQFTASGEINFESCAGSFHGQRLNLQLEAYDVGPKLRATAEYQACFGRLPTHPGPYLKPH